MTRLTGNRPQAFNAAFRTLWEARYPGERYFVTGTDLRKAKELIENNPDLHMSDVAAHFGQYSKNDYWLSRRLPAYALWAHFSEFLPARVRSAGKKMTRMIDCSACNTSHDIDTPCPLPKDAVERADPAEIVATLAKAFAAPKGKHDAPRLPRDFRARHGEGDK